MKSCLPRRPKKQIPKSSKHEGASQCVVEFIQPCNLPDQKENLESSGEILWHEILHEILADCSVWVPVCGLGHVNYVRAPNGGWRRAVLCTQQHRRWLHSAPERRVGPVRSLWSSQQSDQAAAARQSCRGNARTLLHPARRANIQSGLYFSKYINRTKG